MRSVRLRIRWSRRHSIRRGRPFRERAKVLTKQIEALDEALSREMNRVMQQMGNALGQITGKFVDDYTKLGDADEADCPGRAGNKAMRVWADRLFGTGTGGRW